MLLYSKLKILLYTIKCLLLYKTAVINRVWCALKRISIASYVCMGVTFFTMFGNPCCTQ